MIFNQRTKWDYWFFNWIAESPFVRCPPIRQGILNCIADNRNIPWNPPTIFSSRPDCNNAAEVPLFQQSCSSLDGEVLTDNDSRIGLRRLCQILENCLRKWLCVSASAPRTFASFFLFPVKFLFYADMVGSIELTNLAPRQSIGDCFKIQSHHWELCFKLSSSHQNFLLEVWLCQCVFSKEPL